MSATATAVKTARITPEYFPEQIARTGSRTLVVAALAVILLAGFSLRAYRLGAESLSEDELNKVMAVAEYRAHGLTSANGEHPFLMKALLAASIVTADAWNATSFVESRPQLKVSTEAAARFPGVIFGALSSLLIFLIASELFGSGVGLIAAALWAFDPAGIGFNRVAKEDSFLVFFFLLGNVFWLRGQRVAEGGERNPEPFYWATAACFGAMMASKYVPHFFAISGAYYYAFQGIKRTRWRMGKRKWLIFFAVMGAAFLVCNPTILLPGTWHEMRVFAGERRIGHDAYEYMGQLYRNQMTLWLNGSPWHFYYVFMGVKLPLATVAGFLVGLPLLFMKRLGDGRLFVLFWLFFWFFPFTVLGGKFTRYFTFALPAVLMTAAIGIQFIAQQLARLFERNGDTIGGSPTVREGALSRSIAPSLTVGLPPRFPNLQALMATVLVSFSAYASVSAAPYYRLYTNALGGGRERAGSYFPHDEFYDGSTGDAAKAVARLARNGARVASETPELFNYYAMQAGRNDFKSVSLSDRAALAEFAEGDVIVIMRGRRYFSNDAIVQTLNRESHPAAVITQDGRETARVYILDHASLARIREILGPQPL